MCSPHAPRESQPNEFGDTEAETFNYAADWIEAQV